MLPNAKGMKEVNILLILRYFNSFALKIRSNSIKFHFSSQNQTHTSIQIAFLFCLILLFSHLCGRVGTNAQSLRMKRQISLLVESVNDPVEIHASLQLEALQHPFVRQLIHGHLSRLSRGGSSKLVGVVFSV